MTKRRSFPEQLDLNFGDNAPPKDPQGNLPLKNSEQAPPEQPDMNRLYPPDDPYESLGGGLPPRRKKKR